MSIAHYLESFAEVSPDGRYRYSLMRRWSQSAMIYFVMLNPSTADAAQDDPTIRRCVGFARREGAGGIEVFNLHAFRATRPEDLKLRNGCNDPFGPHNDFVLGFHGELARREGITIVCAWGASGGMFAGDQRALKILRSSGARLVCLGRCGNGMPRHPLYIKADAPFEDFP